MTRDEVIKEIDSSKFWDDITHTLEEDDYFCCPRVEPRKWELNEDGTESIVELYAVENYLYITIQVNDYYTELEVDYNDLEIGKEESDHSFCSPDIVGFKSKNCLKDFFIKLRDADEITEDDTLRHVKELERKIAELEKRIKNAENQLSSMTSDDAVPRCAQIL